MTLAPAILTLGEGVEWVHVFAFVSLLVGLASLVVTILKILDGRTEKAREATEEARDELAQSRHVELCDKIELAHERVTETKKAVEEFRGETGRELAALHAADARLALDLERRVAPLEGAMGIGRIAELEATARAAKGGR